MKETGPKFPKNPDHVQQADAPAQVWIVRSALSLVMGCGGWPPHVGGLLSGGLAPQAVTNVVALLATTLDPP